MGGPGELLELLEDPALASLVRDWNFDAGRSFQEKVLHDLRAPACVSEERISDSLQAGPQNSLDVDGHLKHSSSERNTSETSPSEGGLSHDNASPNETIGSRYSVNLESLDDAIVSDHYKKEVELNEEKTKHAMSAASKAGNDIFIKVEELKEKTAIAVEDNKKVAGEIYAEKSILATEAQELQTRLCNISEETKSFVSTINEMHNTLQRRLSAAEVLRAAAEKAKHEREASAQITLEEHELLLKDAMEESKSLEQQAQENTKLKSFGIFDSITQLQGRVDMQLPVDEPLQLFSSSMASTVESLSPKSSSVELLAAKSSSSFAAESNLILKDDEITDVSDGTFLLDNSWDVVDIEGTVSS